ncbi:sensor histidine kinase [Streptomyces turgidiscabies]|nr:MULTISPECIES: sensor histidine kinase [Streptomyces]MDX3496605.1 sensor histidine kinase [Streptomyces turgidiscabies]GAQ72802.1 sensor histidine kinase LiaS [Streptomyces turgidiscabies]
MADHGAIAVNAAQLLSDAQQKAALEERNRMARDLHDLVSQSLFSMRLRTKALQMAAGRVPEAGESLLPGLQALESLIDRSVSDMRALISHLRPVDLRGNDVGVAIRRFAHEVSERDGVLVEVRSPAVLPALTSDSEEQIYQIAREAIGNSVNHARASRISVRINLTWTGAVRTLTVVIADDGAGFDPEVVRPGHVGLTSMRTRAREIGAELRVESSSDGTVVQLQLPLASSTEGSPT